MRYEIKLIAEVDEPQSRDTFLRLLQAGLAHFIDARIKLMRSP